MIVYIVIALVLLALLFGAYRALGRPAAAVTEPRALLRNVMRSASEAVAELSAATPVSGFDDSSETRVARLRGIRRTLDGCAQELERIDVAALDAVAASVHRSLSAAIDEATWAVRMAGTSAAARGGVRRALDELQESATKSLDEARELFESTLPSEPVQGAR